MGETKKFLSKSDHGFIDKIYVGIVARHFCKFVTELWPLIDARISCVCVFFFFKIYLDRIDKI